MPKHFLQTILSASIFFSSTIINIYGDIKSFGSENKTDYKILEQDPSKVSRYIVKSINITGEKNLDKELVRTYIKIKDNQIIQLPSTSIKENIENLLSCDFIKNAACYVSFIDDIHIGLIFEIEEFPIIDEYSFVGITEKQKEELLSKINFTLDRPASTQYLSSLRRNIKKYYSKGGGKIPNIDFKFLSLQTESNNNHIRLQITIPPKVKTYINEVFIEGNDNVSSYFIKPELSLREKAKFTLIKDILYKTITFQPLSKKGYLTTGYKFEDIIRYIKNNLIFFNTNFNSDLLQGDKEEILSILSSHGYYDAKILNTKVNYYKNGAVDVKYVVDEGQKYFINSIKWKGNTKLRTEELSRLFGFKKGDVYDPVAIRRKIGDLSLILYRNKGSLACQIDSVIVGINGNKVDLEMRISGEDIYRINEVIFSGNKYTFDEIIRRNIDITPGNKFNQFDLMLSRDNLARLGYFEEAKLNIQPININKKKKTIDFLVDVVEHPGIRAELALSNNLQGKASVKAGFQCNNISIKDIVTFKGFFGGAQKMNIDYLFHSIDHQGITLSFGDPYLTNGRYNWGYDIDFSAQFNSKDDAGKNNYLLNMLFRKQLPWGGNKYLFSFGPRVEISSFISQQIEIFNKKTEIKKGSSTELSLKCNLIRRTQNGMFFPKKGSLISLEFVTTPPYGWFKKHNENESLEDKIKLQDFGSLLLEGDHYFNIVDNLVFMLRYKSGLCYSYSDELLTHRYTMGGESVSSKIVSGMDALSNSNIPLRGFSTTIFNSGDEGSKKKQIFTVATVEARFLPFALDMLQMYVLGFLDAGILVNDLSKISLENIKASTGIGFRINLPILGILGLDWGFDINSKETDKWTVRFRLGN